MGLLKMLDKDEYIEYEDINGDDDTDNESTNNTHRKTDQTKTIYLSSFNDERPTSSTNQNYKKRFLPIGCSGGNGHNTAITAFIHYFCKFCATVYTPVDYAEKPHSITSISIFAATQLNSFLNINSILSPLGLPTLPSHIELTEAIQQLRNVHPRQYIDMMLDVFPTGFENAAIWNTLQRKDQKGALKKLIDLQSQSDATNYQTVYNYILTLLMQAHNEGIPYTDIISTQAQALPALCDAVLEYNKRFKPNVMIHQYLTDLPTKGATHFFNPLTRLTAAQQQCMKLYGVGMTEEIISHFFPDTAYFHDVYTIDPKHNPMVRPGFFTSENDNSHHFHIPVHLHLKDHSTITIETNEKIAALMLGSQAGDDTIRYITNLLYNGVDRVFVFGGSNPVLREKVATLLKTCEELSFAEKVVLLKPQDDNFISALMTRSHIVITRAGGLSVMEQMAMNHNPEQTIFIHHADSNELDLLSGISWEDYNADGLIEKLTKQGIRVMKTCPSEFTTHLTSTMGSHSNASIDEEGLTIIETTDGLTIIEKRQENLSEGYHMP
jgi:hypothetical protein